jgi:predicted nucleotidyltransferase
MAHNMVDQQTKNTSIINRDEGYTPVVHPESGEIQSSASFSLAEQTAIVRILSDTDAKLIAGDPCLGWQRLKKESYNRVMSPTALDLSPEALKKYRPLDAVRRRRVEQAAEISSRLRRARLAAHKAAKLLKTKFGAKEVILFGSLARRVDFTRWSDIDLASRGIPSERYLTAMDTVLHMNPEFKIDLAELETCRPAMRKSIEADGEPL